MTSEEGTISDAVQQLKTTGEQGVSSITIDRNKILGQGTYGIVFEGTWKEEKVAVKRIQTANSKSSKQEEEALQKLEHPNVVRLFHVDSNADFKDFALEFCQASLNHLFLKETDPEKYRGPMPSKKDVLLQLASGLAHIHEMGLIHRDLKPGNVLIWADSTGDKVLMKWADFGLSKPVNENGSCSMSGSNRGTDNWYSPEILKITIQQDDDKFGKKDDKKEKKDKKDKTKDKEMSEEKDEKKEKKEKKKEKKKYEEKKGAENVIDPEIKITSPRQRATIKSDVFTEGLIFGYYLLGGRHPYGPTFQIALNILDEKPVNLMKEMKKQKQPIHDIIMEMLNSNPDERISSSDVVSKITDITIE